MGCLIFDFAKNQNFSLQNLSFRNTYTYAYTVENNMNIIVYGFYFTLINKDVVWYKHKLLFLIEISAVLKHIMKFFYTPDVSNDSDVLVYTPNIYI